MPHKLTHTYRFSPHGRALRWLAVVWLLAALLPACQARQVLAIGEPAPAFSLKNETGDQVKLASLQGDVVLLSFWAGWCEPCKEEMPLFQSALEAYADQGLSVVLVAVADSQEEVSAFMADHDYTFLSLVDARSEVKALYNAQALPMTVIIDPQGVARNIRIGPYESLAELAAEIEPLLPMRKPSSTPTPGPSATQTPTQTVTNTALPPSDTPTATQAPSGTPTVTSTFTATPTATATRKPLPTWTPTFTPQPPFYGISLQAATTNLTAPAGEMVIFNTTLVNTGNVPDTYDLMITRLLPEGWEGMFCFDKGCYFDGVWPVTLQAGEQKLVEIKIKSSPASVPGLSGTVILAASSQGDPFQSASVSVTLAVP